MTDDPTGRFRPVGRRTAMLGAAAFLTMTSALRAEDANGARAEPLALVRLRPADMGPVQIAALVLWQDGTAYAADLGQGARRFDEDRIPTSRFTGGLTRPTVAERLDGAREIGLADLSGGLLSLRLREPVDIGAARVTLAHRSLSWDMPRLRPAPLPEPSGAPVGRVHVAEDGRILVLVPPIDRG